MVLPGQRKRPLPKAMPKSHAVKKTAMKAKVGKVLKTAKVSKTVTAKATKTAKVAKEAKAAKASTKVAKVAKETKVVKSKQPKAAGTKVTRGKKPGRPQTNRVAKGRRARYQVELGRKRQTVGKLTKEKLVRNRRNRIVSKKASDLAKKRYETSPIKLWYLCVKEARIALRITGWCPVGGKSMMGKALLLKAKKLFQDSKPQWLQQQRDLAVGSPAESLDSAESVVLVGEHKTVVSAGVPGG